MVWKFDNFLNPDLEGDAVGIVKGVDLLIGVCGYATGLHIYSISYIYRADY